MNDIIWQKKTFLLKIINVQIVNNLVFFKNIFFQINDNLKKSTR